jgi:hypothetical protein
MANDNKYSVNSKISDLQARVLSLETANKELRVHLWGALETKANDLKHVIQDSIRVPLDGRNGIDGANGATGQQGIQGVPGDVTYITPAEVAAQVQALRLKLAKWQAAIQFAYEQNYGTKHSGLKIAIDNVLKAIENQAQ